LPVELLEVQIVTFYQPYRASDESDAQEETNPLKAVR
jgi:hypothetical protein